MLLVIRFSINNGPLQSFKTEKQEFLVGRSLNGNYGLELARDNSIEKQHLFLFYDLSTWWFEPVSKTGVFVNNTLVQNVTEIPSGTVLIIGQTYLEFLYDQPFPENLSVENGIIDSEYLVEETIPPSTISEDKKLSIYTGIRSIALKYQGQAMLDALVKELIRLFPQADRAGIILYKDKELLPVAFLPDDRAYVSFTLARKSIRERKALIWERAAASVSSQMIPSLDDVISALYVPIVTNRRSRGIIHFDSCSINYSFTQAELDLLIEVATSIGEFITIEGEESLSKLPSAFISYSHKDQSFVAQLAGDLRRKPISIWYDERLRAGKEWQAQLASAIESADAFVLVMTSESLESDYVQWELAQARKAKKRIFPLMYRECKVPKDLGRIQYLKIGEDYKSALAELADELFAMTE